VVVDVPEFLSKLAKVKPDQVPTEMQLPHERYATPLIFLGGHIYQDEVLAELHFCG